MKNLLLILALVFAFACHTKEDQNQSGINDPTNITYGDADSSVLNASPKPTEALAEAPKEVALPCIDSSKIQADVMCTADHKPVCGCDGKEYPNQCEAEKAGVTKTTEGPCKK